MSFAHPQILWLLLVLILPLCAFLFWAWRTKQKLIAQFVQSRLLANLTVGVSQTRQKLRLVLMAGAVVFLIFAMARPQWGFSWEEARQQGLDIVVAIDTSRSMLAEDLAPNRLTRAKLAALDLMRLSKSDRLGLVAFAGSAFLQCPLTLDEEAFRQSVEALDVGIIPQGGTALTEAIQSALTAFEKGNENHKVLVLFTDGEDHERDALTAAEASAKEGLRIFTIGVGTAEGEMVRIRDEQGGVGFLKDDAGNAVKSRLNETLLQQIATAANGFYLPLRGAKPMETLYAQGLAPLPKSDSTTKLVRQYRERFHWPLGMAIFLLVLEMLLPQRKRVQPPPGNNGISANKAVPSAVVVSLLFLFATFPADASPSRAMKEYESGNFHTALDEFKKLSREKTNDFRLSYNAGTAAYRAKQFDDAQKLLGAATASPDLQLQQQAYYNLGNTLFEVGEQLQEPDKKQSAWENSAKTFENSLKLNPDDTDAKNNLEFVRKKLEELKQQQQQQSKNDQSKDQDNQDKNEQEQNQDQKQNSEQKDDKSKQEEAKEDQQQKDSQQEQQAKEDQQKKEQQQNQQDARESKPDDKEGDEQQEAMAMIGQMTPEQALQFLDAQKQEDKALIFAPPPDPKQVNRKLKDW